MILRPGEKAIAIVLPEARAIALVEAARAAGRLAGPETVRLEGFVMVAEAAFERLSNGVRESCETARLDRAGTGRGGR
jgi:hypothetical protein